MNSDAVRVSRRNNGGIAVNQRSSFLLLNRSEATQLIADIQSILNREDARGADTAKRLEHT